MSETHERPNAALLSAAAGRAIVRTSDDAFFMLRAGSSVPEPCDGTSWSQLRVLHPAAELRPAGNYPFPELASELLIRWRRHRALALTLVALDSDHEDALRLEACAVVDGFLEDKIQALILRTELLTQPLPEEADLEGLVRCLQGKASALIALLQEVAKAAGIIEEVRSAWAVAVRSLPDPDDRARAEASREQQHAIGRLVSLWLHGGVDRRRLHTIIRRAVQQLSKPGGRIEPTLSTEVTRTEPRAGGGALSVSRGRGMVVVRGVTYRIDRRAAHQYDVVRLLDDVKVGSFTTLPSLRLEPTALDAGILRDIVRAALRSARTSAVSHAAPSASESGSESESATEAPSRPTLAPDWWAPSPTRPR